MNKKPFLFALNKQTKTIQPMAGVGSFEQLQGMFRCGIKLSNGDMANGIGRCKDLLELMQRAKAHNWIVLNNWPPSADTLVDGETN